MEGEEQERGEKKKVHVRYALEIDYILSVLKIPQSVRRHALAVFKSLYQAEASVHGESLDNIHLHEVGSLDAIADIVSVCWILEELGVEKAYSSPLNTGSGTVRAAHGVLPVPAPATAQLIKNYPSYSDGTAGELLTPTAAALITYFCEPVSGSPVMKIKKIGYGMGTKEFASRLNCVRAFLYEDAGAGGQTSQTVWEICANIDDMTPEELSFAASVLLEEGALDVFITPAVMKKGRSGHVLTVLSIDGCQGETASRILSLTTTIGIRMARKDRIVLDREEDVFSSSLGDVRLKISGSGETCKIKFEYDDVAEIARAASMSVAAVRRILEREYAQES